MLDSQYLMIHHYQYKQKQKEKKKKKELERIKELEKEIERKKELEKETKEKKVNHVWFNPYVSLPPVEFSDLEREWFDKIKKK